MQQRSQRRLSHLLGAVGAATAGAPAGRPPQRVGPAPDHTDYRSQYRARMRELGMPLPPPPFTTGGSYHTTEGLGQEAILDWAAVLEQFDQDAFMRDGVAVLRGVMTPAATRRLRASCERVQELNDEWLDHDWLEPAQWEQMGWRPPTCEPLSEEEKSKARGASQVLNGVLGRIWRSARENNAKATPGNPNFVRDSHSIRWPKGRGFAPEIFPACYDPFMMTMMCHPQMIRLHQLMLGPEVRCDHNRILSRRSFAGQAWHSHDYSEDNAGVTTRPGGARLRLCRSLVYPDGFKGRNDGGLKVVPGAHLFRSQALTDSAIPYARQAVPPGDEDDAELERTWLAGKRHPITGDPLRIEHLELPPGSMVTALTHIPHAVSPRPPGSGTRHCALFSYREPDPDGRVPITTAASQPWELERDCALGEIPGLKGGPVNLFSLY